MPLWDCSPLAYNTESSLVRTPIRSMTPAGIRAGFYPQNRSHLAWHSHRRRWLLATLLTLAILLLLGGWAWTVYAYPGQHSLGGAGILLAVLCGAWVFNTQRPKATDALSNALPLLDSSSSKNPAPPKVPEGAERFSTDKPYGTPPSQQPLSPSPPPSGASSGQASSAQAVFYASIIHDLKSPLQAEARVLSLLKAGDFGSLTLQQEHLIEDVLRSNRFMTQLVDNMMLGFHYETGAPTFQLSPTLLNTLIQETLAESRLLFWGEKHQLEVDLAADLPPVWGDAFHLRRVLLNLLQNARKAVGESGHIVIASELLPEEGIRPTQVRVSVTDSGPDLSQETLNVLLRRSRSLDHVAMGPGGHGLGLYLSLRIIEDHGGVLGAKSRPGQGNCFYFTLPVADAL